MMEPGTTVLGSSRVAALEQSGMGTPLLARPLPLEQRVAITCLLPEMLGITMWSSAFAAKPGRVGEAGTTQ